MHMGTKVARAIRIPVATGERLCTKFAFQEILRLDAVDVIQPDLCHAGGLTEVKKIVATAEAGYVQVAPHNASGLVGTATAVQLDAVIPNFLIQEYFVAQASWIDDVVLGGPRVVHGEFVVSDRPELGVDLSEEAAAVHPFQSSSGERASSTRADRPGSERHRELEAEHDRVRRPARPARIDDVLDVRLDLEPGGHLDDVSPLEDQLVVLGEGARSPL